MAPPHGKWRLPLEAGKLSRTMLRSTCLVIGSLALFNATGCGSDASNSGGSAGATVGTGGSTPGTGGASPGSAGSTAGVPGSSAGSGGAAGNASAAAGSGGSTAAAGAGGTSAGSAGVAGSAGGSVGAAGGSSAPLFSDGFEGASIDAASWTPRINGNGKFDLDSTQKHGGSKSLHLKHSGFSSLLAFEGKNVFPAPNNTFYARLWLRVTGPLPQGHVVWFEAGEVSNDTHEVRVGMNIGKFQSNLYYQGEVDIRDPQAKIMAATWQCVQVKYGPDVLDVSLDGVHSSISTTTWVAANQADGSTTTPKTNWAPNYAAFRIGWELGDGEIWFDDVALSHSPIPCD